MAGVLFGTFALERMAVLEVFSPYNVILGGVAGVLLSTHGRWCARSRSASALGSLNFFAFATVIYAAMLLARCLAEEKRTNKRTREKEQTRERERRRTVARGVTWLEPTGCGPKREPRYQRERGARARGASFWEAPRSRAATSQRARRPRRNAGRHSAVFSFAELRTADAFVRRQADSLLGADDVFGIGDDGGGDDGGGGGGDDAMAASGGSGSGSGGSGSGSGSGLGDDGGGGSSTVFVSDRDDALDELQARSRRALSFSSFFSPPRCWYAPSQLDTRAKPA